MATPPKSMDRRVQRTHQLLRQAAIETMKEKGFLAMTIQDIADRANVNRGTFYAHYLDKYALLDELIHDQFQELLKKSLPPESRWNKQTLRLLMKVVLEHFEDEYHQCDPTEVVDPLIERATKDALADLLLAWLKQEMSAGTKFRVPVETIARVISWTILGAAAHWYQEGIKLSAEQVADDVLLIVMEGVTHLALDTKRV
ncbi:TetR/AcrR family transcriptional regulator [Ktedonospora formicarum]|uniref:TetR family transcriptional regulator n=1 Tax=Ktedonospora formicarum TaxID=2778364 RepID=A0A8J3I9B4_9CHLR|nr:TetR/AcrR family transcriptional regulator [Ktedonospora formicarum]GHO47839.1 TetR family transcriptional regulator [Ktedonospora formicarum]